MKKSVLVLGLGLVMAAGTAFAGDEGEALFQKHCMACHPDGGNIMSPGKTLHSADLKANGIEGVDGIVAQMRNPGPGMPKFDENTLSDEQAKKIAEYIVHEFK